MVTFVMGRLNVTPQRMKQTKKNFLDIRQMEGGNIFCNVGKIIPKRIFYTGYPKSHAVFAVF